MASVASADSPGPGGGIELSIERARNCARACLTSTGLASYVAHPARDIAIAVDARTAPIRAAGPGRFMWKACRCEERGKRLRVGSRAPRRSASRRRCAPMDGTHAAIAPRTRLRYTNSRMDRRPIDSASRPRRAGGRRGRSVCAGAHASMNRTAGSATSTAKAAKACTSTRVADACASGTSTWRCRGHSGQQSFGSPGRPCDAQWAWS